jgi:hypothetical protein
MRALPIVVRVDGRYHARVKAERDALAGLLADMSEHLAAIAADACCQAHRDDAEALLARLERAARP